jgi:DNA-binding winged helix-turn-helix (wHTH) protein/tetratricopeptide (TPR) repeat protein/TolB-like protein
MSAPDSPVYQFGPFQLDPRERRLSGNGDAITLTPKVFDTLVVLVERAGSIVTKDELMKIVWPRGFVDESNLTKHIWLIRKALGDGAAEDAYIETIPKVGYRFVAAVTSPPRDVADATPESNPAPAPAPTVPSNARRIGTWAALGCLVVVLAVAWKKWGPSTAAHPSVARVALVGFDNLSQNGADAWLAPALVAMLGTELGGVPELEVIPSELVRDAAFDLGSAGAGGYSPQKIDRLRLRLNADYVVTGSYLVTNGSEGPQLRLDVAVQETHTGKVRAVATDQGALNGLNSLASAAGASLRTKLGVETPEPGYTATLANAQPPNMEVARHMGAALDALARRDAARARDESLEAVALAPNYAPAYAALARAWAGLGYVQKSLAAAEQALRHGDKLPLEMRLQIAATVAAGKYDWPGAVDAWQTLVDARPLSVDYRLQLVGALLSAARVPAAHAALVELRRLPEATGDPRVALAAAVVAGGEDDPKRALVESTEALREARAREAPGLIADTENQLAFDQWRNGSLDAAEKSYLAAIDGYRVLGNPDSEALARHRLANVLIDLHRKQDAQEQDQRATAIFQSVGDTGGIAAILQGQSEMLWEAGDRDGAETAARNALKLARELGNLGKQAWLLRALATIASDEAATDEAVGEFREANAIDERINTPSGIAFGLAYYADVARLRGELGDAHRACVKALNNVADGKNVDSTINVTLTCALVSVDRGETAAAITALQTVDALTQQNRGFDVAAGNAQLSLAQLDIDAGRWAAAGEHLRHARQLFVGGEIRTGEADAEAMLAYCAEALGDAAERLRAEQRARELRGSITSRQEVFGLEIALARLAGGDAQRAQSLRQLRELANDAEGRHWLAWSVEAKLAAWQLSNAHGDRAASQALRQDLEPTARRLGFGRVLALLNPPSATAAAATPRSGL